MACLRLFTQTAAEWTAENPRHERGAIGIEVDEEGVYGKSKIFDGVTRWNSLPYFNPGGSVESADVLRSYLAETVTYNNVAVLAATALSVTVVASGIYNIELVVHETDAAVGLKLDFAGTATITNFIGEWMYLVTPMDFGGPSGNSSERVTAAGTDFTAGNGPASTIRFRGSVEINAAGTFLLRGAQSSADASDTQILRGSTLVLTKMN
jgi:hypothetical protein